MALLWLIVITHLIRFQIQSGRMEYMASNGKKKKYELVTGNEAIAGGM